MKNGNRWASFFQLCWCFGHDDFPIVDSDARRSFHRCRRCGREAQYDFEAEIPSNWIGFIDDVHRCPLCLGWKPKDIDRCANEICDLNPNGPLRIMPDGSVRHMLDGPHGFEIR